MLSAFLSAEELQLVQTNLAADSEGKEEIGIATRYFSAVFVSFFFLVFTPSWYFLIRDFLQHLWRLSLDATAAIPPDGFKFCSRDMLPESSVLWNKTRWKRSFKLWF